MLLHSHFGYRVERDGGRLRFRSSTGLITALVALGAAFAALGTLACLGLVVATRDPVLLAPVLLTAALAAMLAWSVRTRRRSMGNFVVDPAAKTLSREGGATWRFDEVTSVRTRIDPFERNPAAFVHGQARWLEAQLRDGTTLRLCKGHPPAVQPLVDELRAAGLPCE